MTETGTTPIIFGSGSEDFRQAEWLAIVLAGEWRHDYSTSLWHHWNGFRWEPDRTGQLLKTIADKAAEGIKEAELETTRKSLLKLYNVPPLKRALEALATFEGYGTDGDDWDTDPYLIGCENGVVDLRTGAMAGMGPESLVTKTTGQHYIALDLSSGVHAAMEQRCPKFWHHLLQWTSDDWGVENEDMAAFLLQWFGTALFGFTPEQKFLVMTGIGRNGKGTLKNAVMAATGDYGMQSDQNLYMRSKNGAARSDGPRADLIKLKGARVGFFSEPEGGRFNEELLKNHTGQDVINARALFSNIVSQWKATHSITFLVNDLPAVDDVGPSMIERVLVADFRLRWEGSNPNPDRRPNTRLEDELAAEAEGILALLVWAAGVWYKRYSAGQLGLILPERVIESSKHFIERNDPVVTCIEEAFEVGDGLTCAGQVAYDVYLQWHARSGADDEPVSMVRFTQALEKRGFGRYRSAATRGWKGLKPLGVMALAERGDQGDDDE